MYVAIVCRLGAGFGLFLAGVRIVRSGLEGLAETGLRGALRFLAGTPGRGVILGGAVTGLVQSSGVTTTLIVALAGARAISLREAIGLILGANIGATVTVQMLAFSVHRHAQAVVLAGLFVLLLARGRPARAVTIRRVGWTTVGVGLLFLGLRLIGGATGPLASGERFAAVARVLGRRPILGLIGGAAISAAVQSSSVTIAATISACTNGRLDLAGAVPVIIGANMGTCVTAIIAGAWSTVYARRAAAAHLLFNSACAGLFMALLQPFVAVVSCTSASIASQLANAHSLFNVVGTLLALPFVDAVASAVERAVPGPRD
ncbi:MAG: Na/Pi cotransporter family protein [Ignavibacteriales bacterium]